MNIENAHPVWECSVYLTILRNPARSQILAALHDLAGKFGTRTTAVTTQSCTRPSATSLGDELSHQGPVSIRRFNQLLSLNLNSELTYSEMGNSEFSVTEQLNCVSLLNSK